MQKEYDFSNAEQGKFYTDIEEIEIPDDRRNFMMDSMDKVFHRIEYAEINADYMEHDAFWKQSDNERTVE